MIVLPKKWTRQPQFNVPAQEQALRHAWTTFAHGGVGPGALGIFDAGFGRADGLFGIGNSGTTGNSVVASVPGNVVNFDNSGTGTAASTIIKVGSSAGTGSPNGTIFSMFAIVYIASSANQAIYGSSGANGVEWRIDVTTNKQNLLKTGLASIGTSNSAVPLGQWNTLGLSYDGTNAAFYLNGATDGTASSAQTFTHSQQYQIGSANNEFLTNGSKVALMTVWDNVLDPSVFKSLHVNAWQIFAPQMNRIYSEAGGVAPPSTAQGIMFPAALSGIGSQGIFFGDRLQ